MDPKVLIEIIEIATGLVKTALDGTRAQGATDTVIAFEQIIEKALAQHQAEVGTPMDLSKFQDEPHAE